MWRSWNQFVNMYIECLVEQFPPIEFEIGENLLRKMFLISKTQIDSSLISSHLFLSHLFTVVITSRLNQQTATTNIIITLLPPKKVPSFFVNFWAQTRKLHETDLRWPGRTCFIPFAMGMRFCERAHTGLLFVIIWLNTVKDDYDEQLSLSFQQQQCLLIIGIALEL